MKTPFFTGPKGLWLILLLTLGACTAPGYRAEVTRFHELGAPAGETIQIIPAEGIEEGLEFQRYALHLAQNFADYGYLPAEDLPPMIIAKLGYDAKPDPNFRGSSGPTIGIGVGGSTGHVGVGVGTTFDSKPDDGVYYLHTIHLVMEEAGTGKRLFEGRASGHERGEYWPAMMPRLLAALFSGWPGLSGETEQINLNNN